LNPSSLCEMLNNSYQQSFQKIMTTCLFSIVSFG
jgi:hypothetical protein